jgi:putative ABC transport system permease protein
MQVPLAQLLPDVSGSLAIALAVAVALVLLLLFSGRIPISYNLRNLLGRWRTTALTALAFTLVVALLTVMLAFVNGMYALTDGSGHPENVIILAEGATDETFSSFPFADLSDLGNQPQIAKLDGAALLSRETYLVVNQPLVNAPPGRPKRRFLQLRGIEEPRIAATVHAVELLPGSQWFSESGVRELEIDGQKVSAVEVVIGEGLAGELGKDRPPEVVARAINATRLDVADTFTLNDRSWVVVGVMKSSGSTFDSEVWAKQSLIGPMFGKDTFSTLVARATSPAAARELDEFLNNEYKTVSVSAQLETEYFESLSQTNVQFLVAIIIVTAILAMGGVFGVMNTMFAAISQRTKDIGVLRLLGFKRRQILVAFLLESVLIAILGGSLGLLIGSLVDGWTASSIVSSGQGGGGKFVVLELVVDANTMAVGMVLTIVTGLIGGLLPALNAMRLSALEALR